MNTQYKKEFIDTLMRAAKNKADLEVFLSDMLTPAEYNEVTVRLQVLKRLAKGEPQRTIAKELKIGIATVTRGSRVLASGKKK